MASLAALGRELRGCCSVCRCGRSSCFLCVCSLFTVRTVALRVNTDGSSVSDPPDNEWEISERHGGRNGLHRGSPPAAEEPERLAELQRRLLERNGEDVREEDHDPGRPEPRQEQRRQPAGKQAGQPRRCPGSPAERDGNVCADFRRKWSSRGV